MVMIKATPQTEAGQMPGEDVLRPWAATTKNWPTLACCSAARPAASSKGARVRFEGERCSVIDGPFAETRELIAGFWLFQTASLQEAINWVRRCPPSAIGEAEIEIRQVFEAEDFGAEFTPNCASERLRAQLNH